MADGRTEIHDKKRDRHGFWDRGEIVQEHVRQREWRDARSGRGEPDVPKHTAPRGTLLHHQITQMTESLNPMTTADAPDQEAVGRIRTAREAVDEGHDRRADG